jgi:hypothetical protein
MDFMSFYAHLMQKICPQFLLVIFGRNFIHYTGICPKMSEIAIYKFDTRHQVILRLQWLLASKENGNV